MCVSVHIHVQVRGFRRGNILDLIYGLCLLYSNKERNILGDGIVWTWFSFVCSKNFLTVDFLRILFL